jgi:hypothetical protein
MKDLQVPSQTHRGQILETRKPYISRAVEVTQSTVHYMLRSLACLNHLPVVGITTTTTST